MFEVCGGKDDAEWKRSGRRSRTCGEERENEWTNGIAVEIVGSLTDIGTCQIAWTRSGVSEVRAIAE